MPIRFRCTACGGVLSIAKRKAGSNVLCPKCAVSVVVPGASTVPDPDRTEAPARPAVGGGPVIAGRPVAANGSAAKRTTKPAADPPLFERLDFEALLQPAAARAQAEAKPAAVAAPVVPPAPKPDRFPARTEP